NKEKGTTSEVAEKFTNACATWKSGASAPRKDFKINSASAAVVVFAVRHDFFRNLFKFVPYAHSPVGLWPLSFSFRLLSFKSRATPLRGVALSNPAYCAGADATVAGPATGALAVTSATGAIFTV